MFRFEHELDGAQVSWKNIGFREELILFHRSRWGIILRGIKIVKSIGRCSSAIERIANIVSGGKIRNNESGMNTKVSVYGCQFSCIDVSVKGAIGAVDRRNE